METLTRGLIAVWLFYSTLYGFGEGNKIGQIVKTISSHVEQIAYREGLLFWHRTYSIPFSIKGGQGIVKLNITGSRLPVGKGKIDGVIDFTDQKGKLHKKIAKINGITTNFRKFQFKITPFQLGKWSFGIGRGLVKVTGNRVKGLITFPKVIYKGEGITVTGHVVTIQWENSLRFKPTTSAGLVSFNLPQWQIQIMAVGAEVKDAQSQIFLFRPKLEFVVANRKIEQVGVLELLEKGIEQKILNQPSTLRLSFRCGNVVAEGIDLGEAKFLLTTSFQTAQNLISRLLNRQWDGLMVSFQLKGSKPLINALRTSLGKGIPGLVWDNLNPVGKGYNLKVELKREGELSINGKRVLP